MILRRVYNFLLILMLFDDVLPTACHIASNDRMTANDIAMCFYNY